MKVAILQCDTVLEKLQPQFGDYVDMIQHMFTSIDEPFEFDVFDVQHNTYPNNIDAYDFYITTGSKAGVYEDLPWIQTFIDFIRLLDKQRKKLIGICFGHQIIAKALYCKVEKSKKGWGIGVAVNRIVARPDWMENTSDQNKTELNILVSHQDQVMTLTSKAVVIAESDFCPYFLVQWNSHFLSIQGHPEWLADYSRTRINDRKAVIPAERINEGLDSLSIELDNALFTRWVMNFLIQK